MQGEGKNLNPIHYGPFKILEKIGINALKIDLPPYMQIYSIANVENLILFETPLIDDQGEHVHLPSIDDFSLEYLMNFSNISYLTEESKLQEEGMLNTLEWDSRVKILQRPNG